MLPREIQDTAGPVMYGVIRGPQVRLRARLVRCRLQRGPESHAMGVQPVHPGPQALNDEAHQGRHASLR